MTARTAPRALIALALSLACLALLAPSASARARDDDSVGFAVEPLLFEVEANSSHQVTIHNTMPKDAIFTLSKEDFEGDASDPDGTPRLLGGEFESSISGYDYLSFSPSSLKVPAGGSRTITVKVRFPSGSTGAHYAALIVSGPTVDIGNGNATSRIATMFMMDAGGKPPPDIVVNEIVTTTGGGEEVVVVTVGGDDDTTVQPEGTITYTDPVTGKVITTEEGECGTALAGGSTECTFQTTPEEAAEKGGTFGAKGSVTLVGEEGRGETVRAETPTEWASDWSSLILPLIGVALFVLYFVFLRRRRRDEEEDVELAV